MICKALWNFSGGMVDARAQSADIFGEAETEDLISILKEFLSLILVLVDVSHADEAVVLEDSDEDQQR